MIPSRMRRRIPDVMMSSYPSLSLTQRLRGRDQRAERAGSKILLKPFVRPSILCQGHYFPGPLLNESKPYVSSFNHEVARQSWSWSLFWLRHFTAAHDNETK